MFEVGDRVVVSGSKSGISSNGLLWIPHMDSLIGISGVIDVVDHSDETYMIDGHHYWLSGEWLMPEGIILSEDDDEDLPDINIDEFVSLFEVER